MVYRRRRVLLFEIDRQCRFAMIAYDDASAALERRDAERCWYSLQGLLTAAMHLHRLLWPPPIGSDDWAAGLRTALEVSEDSPLNQAQLISAMDVTAMLESWNWPRTTHPTIPSRISSAGLTDAGPAECIRCFDPETGAFTVFGTVVELPPLLNAIADLSQKTELEQQHLRELV